MQAFRSTSDAEQHAGQHQQREQGETALQAQAVQRPEEDDRGRRIQRPLQAQQTGIVMEMRRG
jgi:hypothetical protein